jgi:hypothetical protein
MNFVNILDQHGQSMPRHAPPVLVAHPQYGALGHVDYRGFTPPRRRWASTRALLRDSSRRTVTILRKAEDLAPSFAISAIAAALHRQPQMDATILPLLAGAITNYDGIINARGGGTYQDYWLTLTASFTPVTLSWYDLWKMAWSPGAVPSVTAYTNAGTGGAVLDATSNGSWISNPAGSNRRYIVSVGVTITSLVGLSLAMLMDNLWAGSYSLTSNATINPTTDVAVTRYTGSASAGNMMMTTLTATLTHTGAGTNTVTYTDQAGTTGKTLASVMPATGPLVNRVIFNTAQNSATVNASSPFMPFTNAGSSGVRSLEQVVISGGTVSNGTVDTKIVRPLLLMPFIAAASYIEQDTTLNIGNMVELANASQVCGCISWAGFSGGTTALTMSSLIRTVEG